MPKLKTHKGAKKRFKITGTGKIKRARANRRHLLTGKSSRRTRRLREATLVSESDYRNIKRLLPYL